MLWYRAAREGSLNMLYHRFIFLTSNTMSKCSVQKRWCFSWAITFYTSPLIHSKRKHIKHFSKLALKILMSCLSIYPRLFVFSCRKVVLQALTSVSALCTSVTSDLTHPVCSWARCQHRRRPTLSASSKKGKQHKKTALKHRWFQAAAKLLGRTKVRLLSLGHPAVSAVPDTDGMEPWPNPKCEYTFHAMCPCKLNILFWNTHILSPTKYCQ